MMTLFIDQNIARRNQISITHTDRDVWYTTPLSTYNRDAGISMTITGRCRAETLLTEKRGYNNGWN